MTYILHRVGKVLASPREIDGVIDAKLITVCGEPNAGNGGRYIAGDPVRDLMYGSKPNTVQICRKCWKEVFFV